MKFEESEEEVIKRGKRIANITFGVIGAFICLILTGILLINFLLDSKEYFVLDVNNKNIDKVLELINNEKNNFNDKYFCNSIYKIEFAYSFPDGTHYTVYCKNEENISFDIDKNGIDTLEKYILENGKKETRYKKGN